MVRVTRRPWLLLPLGSFALGACGGDEWVKIVGVQADSPQSGIVNVALDYCHPAQQTAPLETVIESDSEVHIRLAMKFSGGDRDDCAGMISVQLDAPIADRVVVDDRTGRSFTVEFGVLSPDAPVGSVPDADGPPFVLPDTDSQALLAVERAAPVEFGVWPTFARAGSPDDDLDGSRVGFVAIDATASPIDDVLAEGVEIAVGDRTFVWSTDAENSRTYVGPTPLGHTIALVMLNVEESTAVDLLVEAELVDGRVMFAGQPTPDGWIDTGASTAVMSFLAGATGSSAPIGGTRSLYGQPSAIDEPTWGNIADEFGVTLSAWPVTSDDPDNEARYSLDGELEVDVLRADGTTALGFSAPADSEFFESVVWREGETWLALSRPALGDPAGLIGFAASVRVATPPEAQRFATLVAE